MSILTALGEKLKRRKSPVEFWKSKGVKIGNGCEVYHSANFGSEPYLIEIGDKVRINSGVNFITHDGGVWCVRNLKEEYKNVDIIRRIKVGNNVHIATNAVIMPGVTIGSNCIIGVGAIVTKSVPDNSIAVGVPARVIKTIDEYVEKNRDGFVYTKGMSPEDKKKYLMDNIK